MKLHYPKNFLPVSGSSFPLDPVDYVLRLPFTKSNINFINAVSKSKSKAIKDGIKLEFTDAYVKVTFNGKDINCTYQGVVINDIVKGNKDLSFISKIIWTLDTSNSNLKEITPEIEFLGHSLEDNLHLKGFMLGSKYVPGSNECFKLLSDWSFTIYDDAGKNKPATNLLIPGVVQSDQTSLIEVFKKAAQQGRRLDVINFSAVSDVWGGSCPVTVPKNLTIRIDYINWLFLGLTSLRILADNAWDIGIAGFCKCSLPSANFETADFEIVKE